MMDVYFTKFWWALDGQHTQIFKTRQFQLAVLLCTAQPHSITAKHSTLGLKTTILHARQRR